MRFLMAVLCGCTFIGLALVTTGCGNSQAPRETAPTVERSSPAADDADKVIQASANEPRVPRPAQQPTEAQSTEASPAEPARLPGGEVERGAPVALQVANAAELKMPAVWLTEGHAQANRIKVGDQLPDFQLPDLEGKTQTLSKMLGPKLTVVVFWSQSVGTSLEELADLTPDVINVLGKNGVAVVGINVDKEPQQVDQVAQKVGANFPNLSDPTRAAFAQVATMSLPRTYLVDAKGTVLWFDMEYSRTTRRDLDQAIRFTLTHP